MKKIIAIVMCFGVVGLPPFSFAEEGVIEEIVVTGSYIRGTPEDAALPVDVLTRADMEDVGDPSINEMIRNLNVSSGTLAETNQFDTRGGQGNEGVSTVNLRGLGSARTLVLINSKRHVATEALGVDISAIPGIAISRVEVLKDGAAATYGSDAIGGVVNFITRDNFEGFELRGSYQDIEDSDGDFNIGAIYGGSSGRVSYAISAEYSERSELQIRDRSWALRPFSENPAPGGWSSIGNPGTLLPAVPDGNGGTLTAPFQLGLAPDPNCDALGGTNAGGFCRFQYTFYDNLIEDEETIKVFGELNVDINDQVSFHAEALWHEMDMPEWKTSPSYPPQALTGADRLIEPSHPGLIDLKAQNPGLFSDVDLDGDDIIDVTADQLGAFSWSRMLGVFGRNGEPESVKRETETKRFSMGLDGQFDNGIGFDVSVSWSERQRDIDGSDMFIERMAFAFDGLGGADCDPATGTPGVGPCEYYNPFSNALPRSAVTGMDNPQFNPAVANSSELIDWLTALTGSMTNNEQLVVEAIFNGETGFEMDGGNVGWAAGAQFRKDDYEFKVRDVANRAINPCPFNDPASITLGHATTLDCGAGGAGQLAFLAATDEETTDRSIYGIFAELNLPISEDLDVQLAARYEDYGSKDGGDTFDPKIAVRWDLSEMVTLRGSASTTFRGPPSSFLGGTGTALSFVTPALAFKAVDATGNPDLVPESAVALNFGGILQTDSFYASLDYWSFDFEDPFQLEDENQIVAAYGANGCEDGGAGVGSSACDVLRARLTPLGTSIGGVQRIQRFFINGSDIKTSGLDFVARYTFEEVMSGTVDIGAEGTYTLEYESDDFVSLEGVTLAEGGDFVGLSNEGTPFTPRPELKGNLFLRWGNERHRVGYTARFVSGYDDEASDTPDDLRKIDDHWTHDVTYVNNMVENLTLSLSIFNFTDEDPPQVANDLNYDPYNHSPFGRMIKLGVVYSLGGN
ncbi:MAG: TonB-dependent receptor [Gammaproteobacteria bacterium]|nr:TonB-dependent receptor [Gammaproteobacteria bacterium]